MDSSPQRRRKSVGGNRAALLKLAVQDQVPRNEYVKYLEKFGYPAAAAEWVKDTGADPNDIFNDKSRLVAAKRLIKQLYAEMGNDEELLQAAHLLVQHMDNDVRFQEWFLSLLPNGSGEYKYLHDRINTNSGKPQLFGTQNM